MSNIENEAPEEITQEGLDKLRQSNRDKFNALSRMNVAVDPISILATRLETFIDTFLDDDASLTFEVNFETRIKTNLNEALAQARQSQILQGVQGVNPQKLITGK